MHFTTLLPALSLAASAVGQKFSQYKDANGIEFYEADFSTTVTDGHARLGLALPPADSTDLANEYIGNLVVPRPKSGTWFGIVHKPSMTSALMLLTWVNDGKVMTK